MIKIDIDYNNFPQGETCSSPIIKEALKTAHHKKCCYCETGYIKGEIEHFRPQKNYRWLVDEYENLLFACHDCNQLKGAKLPVKEKKAEKGDSTTVCNKKEVLIMTNPANNNQDFELFFNSKAEMFSLNKSMSETINICQLNRENLMDRRMKILNDFKNAVNEVKFFGQGFEYLKRVLIQPIKNNSELDYVAFRKFIINNWLKEMLK